LALREKRMAEEIASLKVQLANKEKKRISTVESLQNMEMVVIKAEAICGD
jgi:hypothetical protein